MAFASSSKSPVPQGVMLGFPGITSGSPAALMSPRSGLICACLKGAGTLPVTAATAVRQTKRELIARELDISRIWAVTALLGILR